MSYCQNEYLSVKIDKKAEVLKRSQWFTALGKNRKVQSFPGPTPDVTYEFFFFVEEFTDAQNIRNERDSQPFPLPPQVFFTFLPSPQFSTDLTSFRDNSDLSIDFSWYHIL